MGLCIVAIFGHFQNALIFRILALFSSRVLNKTAVMCQQRRFSHVFGIFNFLPKLSIIHGLQPLHCGHFWPFSKSSHFSNNICFFQPFFAYNKFNVFVETFFACFRQFYFFTSTEYFSWVIAFALWPFLAFSKCSHFSSISCFFEPCFE